MIYELTRDEDYYKNKGKEWSGKRFAHLRNVKNRFGAVDNKYNRIENIIDKKECNVGIKLLNIKYKRLGIIITEK